MLKKAKFCEDVEEKSKYFIGVSNLSIFTFRKKYLDIHSRELAFDLSSTNHHLPKQGSNHFQQV